MGAPIHTEVKEDEFHILLNDQERLEYLAPYSFIEISLDRLPFEKYFLTE